MKKTLALLLTLMLLLTMGGCGKKEYLAGEIADPGVVEIGVPGEPADTDPALYDGSLSARAMLGMLYEGLTVVDESGCAVGGVAESWEVTATDDAAKRPVYTFTLREDACWSDGTPVKAEDFIYAWTRIISGEAESPCRYLFDVILGAGSYEDEESELGLEATEDNKLVVTLEGDFAGFTHMTAGMAFSPLREGERLYNGRYAAQEAAEDNTVTLTPNPGYHGAKEPAALTLRYRFGDMASLEALAADGTLQATFGYAGEETAPLTGSDGTAYYYLLNTGRVTEEAERQALAALLRGEEPAGGLPQQAVLLTYDTGTAATAGEALAEQAEKQGMALTVNALPYEQYKAAREEGAYDLLYLAVGSDYPDDAVLLGYFAGGATGNYAGYRNDAYDELLEKANAETDEAARAALLREARVLLEGDGVLIPLGEGRTELYCHSALTGITCDAMGLWDFSRAEYAVA